MTGIISAFVGGSYSSIPVNTVVPSISGTVTVGSTLTSSTGTWTGSPTPTFSYQWQRGTSNIASATSSTYTIQAADIGNTLRCVVTATNAAGSASANSANTITVPKPVGQQAYTSFGTYSWVAPAGVCKVSVVAVGGGGAGQVQNGCGGTCCSASGGGALGYKNNISVTPGNSYTVVVGRGGTGAIGINGQDSYFINSSTVKGGGGRYSRCQNWTGDGGGNGGISVGPFSFNTAGGAGAGGYTGNGGDGGRACGNGQNGSGGGGGGGRGFTTNNPAGGGGGGVGILGSGSNGTGATTAGSGGSGGSGGSSGANASGSPPRNGGNGGDYGGQGGSSAWGGSSRGDGGSGAVRIIWPGCARSFPSTCTGNL